MILSALVLLAAVTTTEPKPEIRNVRISSPKVVLSREKSDSEIQVVGQFKVDMGFSKPMVKTPVVRLACLCEVGGAVLANCVFLDRPGTCSGMGRSDIMKALKLGGVTVDSKSRDRVSTDPVQFTPYLPEVTKGFYSSSVYGSAELKHGFFRLGKSVKLPKLLLYRIEVWQNGCLTAKYESSRTGLAAYEIPEDWHVWQKYPQKFKYADVR